MAYALVGSVGAGVLGAAVNTAVNPAWGAGSSQAAGDLLACLVGGHAAATLPATPSGWLVGTSRLGTSCSITILYKRAAGGDAAPTIAAAAGVAWSAQLMEFSGNMTASDPFDEFSNGVGTTSPLVATAPGPDAGVGELIVAGAAMTYSTAATKTTSHTLSTSSTTASANNDGATNVWHFAFAYGITTSNASADSDSFAYTILKITGAAVAFATFKLPAAASTKTWNARVLGQAVQRGALWAVGLPDGWQRRGGLLVPRAA